VPLALKVELAIIEDVALDVETYPARLEVLGEAELAVLELAVETLEEAWLARLDEVEKATDDV